MLSSVVNNFLLSLAFIGNGGILSFWFLVDITCGAVTFLGRSNFAALRAESQIKTTLTVFFSIATCSSSDIFLTWIFRLLVDIMCVDFLVGYKKRSNNQIEMLRPWFFSIVLFAKILNLTNTHLNTLTFINPCHFRNNYRWVIEKFTTKDFCGLFIWFL